MKALSYVLFSEFEGQSTRQQHRYCRTNIWGVGPDNDIITRLVLKCLSLILESSRIIQWCKILSELTMRWDACIDFRKSFSSAEYNYRNNLLPARISFYSYGLYVHSNKSLILFTWAEIFLSHELRTFKLNGHLNVDPLVAVQSLFSLSLVWI